MLEGWSMVVEGFGGVLYGDIFECFIRATQALLCIEISEASLSLLRMEMPEVQVAAMRNPASVFCG